MYLTRKLKLFFIFCLFTFLNNQNLIALENKILFKVENEIITTIDIYEEIKFLKTFNPEVNNLSEIELYEISKNSILKDKIKKIEVMKFIKELKIKDEFLLQFVKMKYSKISVNSLVDFENYLEENNLNVKTIKEKIIIEIFWKDLIYQKLKNKIIIDKKKIEKEILQNPKKERQRELLLSEIVFYANNKIDYENKYEKILLDIEKKGFKQTAIIHSNSDTASNGGIIGWVKEDNLNQNFQKIVSKLQLGQFSKPIRTSAGFIIIKIEDEKENELKFNLEDKLKEVVQFKIDDQLNQLSSMYFNKIKKNLTIYDL